MTTVWCWCLPLTFIFAQNINTQPDTSDLIQTELPPDRTIEKEPIAIAGLYDSHFIEDPIISAAAINESSTYDATRIMTSKIAGLSISANSYMPGASSRIMLRGFRSFRNSNQPLILLNGFPINNAEWNNTPRDTDQSNRLMDIDANAIESVVLIKSMAGRAKYGIVGGNGILSIKTKSGYQSKPRIFFSTSVGVDQISRKLELQNTYAQGRPDASGANYSGPETFESFSWGPKITDLAYDSDPNYPYDKNGRLLPSYGNAANPAKVYDPYDFFKTAFQANASLQLVGGNNRINYNIISSVNRQQGIIPTNQYQRYNLSTAFDFKVSKKLSLQLEALVSNSNADRSIKGASLNGIMLSVLRTPATFDNTNAEENPVSNSSAYELANGMQRSYNSNRYDNPYWSINKNKNRDKVNRQIIRLAGNYKLNKKLQFLFNVGADQFNNLQEGGRDINLAIRTGGSTSSAYERKAKYNAQNIDLSTVYTIKPHRLLSIASTLGFNYNQSKTNYESIEGTGLLTSNEVTIANLATTNASRSSFDLKRMGGIFSVDMKFKDYLDLTGNLRHDYANKFGTATNGFTSYGLGAGLSILDMVQSKDSRKKINPLKILVHGSLGKFGNEFKVGNERGGYLNATVSGDDFLFPSNVAGLELSSVVVNKDLTSETISGFDVGLDIISNKKNIHFSLVYYSELSDGLILREPIARSSGNTSSINNVGAMSNQGFDVSFSVEPLRKKNFTWTLQVDFNKNKNNVTNIGDYNTEVALSGFLRPFSAAVVNHSNSSIFGTGFKRNEEGLFIIDDEGYPVVDRDSKIIADPNPDWTMYINNTFSINKKITLSAVVDLKQGGEMYCGTCRSLDYYGKSQRSAEERGTSIVFEGVTESGEVNTKSVELTPSNESQDNFYRVKYFDVDELGVYDASWIRLRRVALHYDLTQVIKSKAIRNISISIFAENLLLFTKYPSIDPETNLTGNSGGIGFDYYNNPGTKRYGLTLKASF